MTQKKSILLTILLASIVMIALYPMVFAHINDYLFLGKHDGLKNYYNIAYHIKHDISYAEFGGMNYPYGETLLFVDCHPLLSTVLKLFSTYIFDISNYTVGILNAIMMLSVVLTALFVFLILDFFGLKKQTGIPAALAIAFLSSNVILWKFGHYALSYSCFFPMGWYGLIRFFDCEKNNRMGAWKYTLFIFVNTTVFLFTHVYLGFMLAAFTTAVTMMYWLMSKKVNVRGLLFFGIQVILPMLLLLGLMVAWDHHEGRIDRLYTTEYRASVFNVFFPNYSFTTPWYSAIYDIPDSSKLSWDKVGSYIGFSTTIVMIIALLTWLAGWFGLKKAGKFSSFDKLDGAYVLAAIGFLLFSMAIPFRYDLEYLLIDTMKQFIALGRFAWVFYFVATIYSFVWVDRWMKGRYKNLVMIAMALILFLEGMGQHRMLQKEIVKTENLFKASDQMSVLLSKIEKEDYQSIIPLPMYMEYPSLHTYSNTERNKQLTMSLSYLSGLPLMGAMLSRPSISEMRSVLEVLIPSYYEKDVLNHMDKRPLLIVTTQDPLDTLEQDLINRAQWIYSGDEISLYQLSVDDLLGKNHQSIIGDYVEHPQGYFPLDSTSYLCKDSIHLLEMSFDEMKAAHAFRGGGSLAMKKTDDNTIVYRRLYKIEPNENYELSFWYYNHLYDQAFNHVEVTLSDTAGNIYYQKGWDPARSNIYQRDWAYHQIELVPHQKGDLLKITSKGMEAYGDTVYFDELLLRPVQSDVYRGFEEAGREGIIWNNKEILIDWNGN